MSSFTEKLIVSPEKDGIMWRLEREFTYDVGELGGNEKIVVPEGFLTDFGSIPKIFWNIVSPIGKATAAFVLHDYLYMTQERSRLVSDAILLEALEILGVNWLQRFLIYNGVRVGGWLPWNNHKKENKKLKEMKGD
ncbi:MAG: DUF1353 domain-containing protein [Alphaproteobacteria bacterium]|nr:DUF1353 domain-containing protein [Alphaproteobacteria bacterium]